MAMLNNQMVCVYIYIHTKLPKLQDLSRSRATRQESSRNRRPRLLRICCGWMRVQKWTIPRTYIYIYSSTMEHMGYIYMTYWNNDINWKWPNMSSADTILFLGVCTPVVSEKSFAWCLSHLWGGALCSAYWQHVCSKRIILWYQSFVRSAEGKTLDTLRICIKTMCRSFGRKIEKGGQWLYLI